MPFLLKACLYDRICQKKVFKRWATPCMDPSNKIILMKLYFYFWSWIFHTETQSYVCQSLCKGDWGPHAWPRIIVLFNAVSRVPANLCTNLYCHMQEGEGTRAT